MNNNLHNNNGNDEFAWMSFEVNKSKSVNSMMMNNNNNMNESPPTPPNNTNELNFGIPISKSIQNEFNFGIPMSKSGRPYKPKSNVYNNKRASNNLNEFNFGVPMSKSGMPISLNTSYNTSYNTNSNSNSVQFIIHDTDNPPSYDTVISINDILNKDKKASKTLQSCLKARGWCKITYPNKTNKIIKSVMHNIHKWFNDTDVNKIQI